MISSIHKEVTPISNLCIYPPYMQIKNYTSQVQMQIQYNEQNQVPQSNFSPWNNNFEDQNYSTSSREINDAKARAEFYDQNLQYWFNGQLDVPYHYLNTVTNSSIEKITSCINKNDWILPSMQQVFTNAFENLENIPQSNKSQRDALGNSQLNLCRYSPSSNQIFEYRLCQLLNSIESIDSYNWYENFQYVNNSKNIEQHQYYNKEFGWINEQANTPKTQVSEQEKFNSCVSLFKVTSCVNVPFEVSFKVTHFRFWLFTIETQYAKSPQTLSSETATSVN